MNEPILMPCPHCGNKAVSGELERSGIKAWRSTSLTRTVVSTVWVAGCLNPQCRSSVEGRDEEEAVARWNRRTSSSEVKSVAELEAANRRLSEALHDIHQLTRKPAGDVRAEDWRRIGWIAGVALGAGADEEE